MNENILPKMNSVGHNETFFKTELIMNAILFTDVKKKYCFKEIANEGKIHDNPIVRYTGISVVRTNTAEWTKGFIRELVENVALNTNLKNKFEIRDEYKKIGKKYNELLIEDISKLDFSRIGVPCKWSNTNYKRDTAELIGMKLYNSIMEDDFFKENTSGLKFPIRIKNSTEFLEKIKNKRFSNNFCIGNISLDKLTFLVVPIYHLAEELRPKLEHFGIEIDFYTTYNKLFETTLDRIFTCIKETHGIRK